MIKLITTNKPDGSLTIVTEIEGEVVYHECFRLDGDDIVEYARVTEPVTEASKDGGEEP